MHTAHQWPARPREVPEIKKIKKDFHIKIVLIRRLPSQYAHSQWPARPWEVPGTKKIKKLRNISV